MKTALPTQAPDDLTLAYMAGVMDSDGSINIMRGHGTRPEGGKVIRFMPRISVVQINPIVPELFLKHFGGSLYFYTSPNRPKTRGWWQWYAGGAVAASAVSLMLPHIRLKREQATLFIRFGEMILEQNVARGSRRLTAEQEAQRLALADAIRGLNSRRPSAKARGRQRPETA